MQLLVAAACIGCGGETASALSGRDEGAAPVAKGDRAAIVDVMQTAVKQQGLPNCWIYATAGWAESLHARATGDQVDVSEAYWTFLHWFEQLVEPGNTGEVSHAGSWTRIRSLISKYGLMGEREFLGEDRDPLSPRQTTQRSIARELRQSIASGALSTAEARSNRTLVRDELLRLWKIPPETIEVLTAAFGADMTRTFSTHSGDDQSPEFAAVDDPARGLFSPQSFKVRYSSTPGGELETKALGEAIFEWGLVNYNNGGHDPRIFQRRVQRAMHDGLPVIMVWFIDHDALDWRGSFSLTTRAPRKYPLHFSVLHDYQAKVSGIGTVPIGPVTLTPSLRAALLSDDTTIDFFRTKNSWGILARDMNFPMPGYYDLHWSYLNGSVKQCATRADGAAIPSSCRPTTPLQGVILPFGY